MMIGPVLDASGVAVTDCVVADFEGSVNGGDPAALNGSATLTHRGVGFYSLALTATDLGTVGTFEVTINDTVNACPMKELTVVEEAIYDALFAASANGFAGAAGSSTVTFSNTSIATVTTATNVTTVNGLAANVITAASIATGAIDADAIADNAIDAGALAADCITAAKVASDVGTEIGTAVWATAARTLTAATNVTSTGGSIPITGGGLVSADVTAISTDTAAADSLETMLDGTGGSTLSLGRLVASGSAAGGIIAVTNDLGPALNITTSSGDAVTISSSDAVDGDGVSIAGAGTGSGLRVAGGATGHGLLARGGATSGDGIRGQGVTSGHGLNLIANGSNAHGLLATGGSGGTSDGVKAVAGTGGVPIRGDLTGNITGNLSGSVGSVTATVGANIIQVNGQTEPADGIQMMGQSYFDNSYAQARIVSMDADVITASALAADAVAEIGTAVWASATRTLTAGTNIQLPANGLANVTAWTVAITGNITGNLSGSVGSVTGAVGSVTGNVGGNVVGTVASVVGAVGSVTGNVGGNVVGSVASVVGNVGGSVASIATDGITAAAVSAAAGAKIADINRRRTQANVEASSDGDTLSLGSMYGVIQQMQESAVAGGTLTVKKTDGTTTLGTKTLTSDAAAEPITGIS